MVVDPDSIWYIARDGQLCWSGTARELRFLALDGGIVGDEALWSDDLPSWVPLANGAETKWIRDVLDKREEDTGVHVDLSQPTGLEALKLPGSQQPLAERPKRQGAATSSGRVIALSALAIPLGIFAAIGFNDSNDAPPEPAIEQPRKAPDQPSQAVAPMPDGQDDDDPEPVGRRSKTAKAKPAKTEATVKKPKPVERQAPLAAPKPVIVKKLADTAKPVEAAKPAKVEAEAQNEAPDPNQVVDRGHAIRRAMTERLNIFDACAGRAASYHPALKGKIRFSISVASDGTINGVSGPVRDKGAQFAAACLLGEFGALRFAVGRPSSVDYTYFAR